MEQSPKRACICVQKSAGYDPSSVYSYPTPGEGEGIKELIEKHGYCVVRKLLSRDEIRETCAEITSVVRRWYEEFQQSGRQDGNDWEELVSRLPAWKRGEMDDPADLELGVRKLHRVAVKNEYFANLSRHKKIVAMITEILGPDVKLVQSMSLFKPPGSGVKKWHQDNAYFRLTPPKVLGVWMALDPANCNNGCMHVLPASHGRGVYSHSTGDATHIDYTMDDLPNPDDVVSVVLEPGDALIFTGETAHYTPPNFSNNKRRSVQFHYAASSCKITSCPRSEAEEQEATERAQRTDRPAYFDCDPSCVEPSYFYYKKAEILVCGKDYGGNYI